MELLDDELSDNENIKKDQHPKEELTKSQKLERLKYIFIYGCLLFGTFIVIAILIFDWFNHLFFNAESGMIWIYFILAPVMGAMYGWAMWEGKQSKITSEKKQKAVVKRKQ